MGYDVEDITSSVSRTVSRLSDLLRKSGSQVLTNKSALSLSWPVYQNVSTALSMSSNQFESERKQNLDVKLILDLEYLSSFLARVPRLHLFHSSVEQSGLTNLHGLIHLMGLNQLRELNISKIPVHLIQDLDQLRGQLEALSLQRCRFTLDSLLSTCLDSAPSFSNWSRLSVLTVSHCELQSLGSCLQLTQGLTKLDCSYNKISDSSGLELLSQLTHLNISYNCLTHVPIFHSNPPLSILLLSYNNIEQLEPLAYLDQLAHLDLTGNCLMHHDALAPISGLSRLIHLDLSNNPLSSHPHHRELASSWLHPSLASLTPSLDKTGLSRSELLQVGSSRLVVSPCVSPSSPINEEGYQSVSCEGSLVSGYTGSTVSRRRRRKKRQKVREVVITDESEYTPTITTENEEPDDRTEKVEDKAEVTETLYGLRKRHGDNWLKSGVSDPLNSLLGIHQSTDTNTDTIIQHMVDRDQIETSQLKKEDITHQETVKSAIRRLSESLDKISRADDGEVEEGDDSKVEAEADLFVGSDNFYSRRSEREANLNDKSSKVNVLRSIPGDDNGLLEELVLVISKEQYDNWEILEEDRRGVIRAKWLLRSLVQLELFDQLESSGEGHVSGDRVRTVMIFKTARKDLREREYVMSKAGYSTVLALVGEVLEANDAVDQDQSQQQTSTADIHNHLVPTHYDNLPDLLPRPLEMKEKKDRSSSPTPTRSNSSSDISVISSEASIEPLPAIKKTSAVSPVEYRVVKESSRSPRPSTPLVFKTPFSTPVKKEVTPPNSLSTPTTLLRDTSSLSFHSCQESSDSSTEEVSDVMETEPALNSSPITWNMTDFTKVDHRVQLYCDMFLFREEEDLLVLVKADIQVRSVARMFPGILVITNKKTYILHITGRETEEPGDWLELVTVGDVSRLVRLVGLLGRQGVALELGGNNKQQPFYRLSSVASLAYTSSVQDESDCYHVVVGGPERTELLVNQLVERLQESVRSSPIPVTWLCSEQETVLASQLTAAGIQDVSLDNIMTTRWFEDGKWQRASIIVSTSSIIISEDYFNWLFTSKHRQLAVKHHVKIDTLKKMAIYQSCPERIRLEFPRLVLSLMMDMESSVQDTVRRIRTVWERERLSTLEEVTSFHLIGGKDVVTMQTLTMDESATFQSFDLSQWIKVTSHAKGN